MSCLDANDVAAYLAEKCSYEDGEAIKQHLMECDRCNLTVSITMEVVYNPVNPFPGFWERMLGSIVGLFRRRAGKLYP